MHKNSRFDEEGNGKGCRKEESENEGSKDKDIEEDAENKMRAFDEKKKRRKKMESKTE